MSDVVRALEVRFTRFLEPHGYMSVVSDLRPVLISGLHAHEVSVI